MLNKKILILPIAALAVMVPLSQVDAANSFKQKRTNKFEELGITVDKQEVDGQLIVTLTSTTEEGLEKIQSSTHREEKLGEALLSKELTTDGVVLTIDQTTLEEIKSERGQKIRGLKNVDIDRQENGDTLIMTLTTEDSETLQKIQSSEKHTQKFGEALISQENIENGTILTIDQTLLEEDILERKNRIQQ